jgi:hypothetical protein
MSKDLESVEGDTSSGAGTGAATAASGTASTTRRAALGITAAATAGFLADLALEPDAAHAEGVTSVNGKAGAVVLTASDVEAVPTSEVGQAKGIAELNNEGRLVEGELPSSVVTGSHHSADAEGNLALGTSFPDIQPPGKESVPTEEPQGNTALGANTLSAVTSGWMNTAVGWGALAAATTSEANTAIGYRALFTQTTGFGEHGQAGNTAIGQRSMEKNTTGHYNVAVGTESLTYNTAGYSNVAVGFNAMEKNVTGEENTAIGSNALKEAKAVGSNVAVGAEALRNGGGGSNLAVGGFALKEATKAHNNTAVGLGALTSLTTGKYNTALGQRAGGENKTGEGCVFIGFEAGRNETGSNRLYIANDETTEPLIWGNFSAKELRFYTNKLGFYGATPVVQPTKPTTLAEVIAALEALGLVA